MNARRKKILITVLALGFLVALFFIPGGKKEEFPVAGEFELAPIVKLPSIGPVDLSINKAVIYLWITAIVIVIVSFVIGRVIRQVPGRFQLIMETIYELTRDGITRSVMHKGADTWFPYIGAVFVFILLSNILGLIPLPLGEHYQPSFYAATANLYVTITLALFTFIFTHAAGIRTKGALKYIRGWAPASAPPVLKQLIWFIHAISELFRLVSLGVRLFANMLAGHAILAVFFAMALIFQSYLAAVVLQAGSIAIYLFEIFVAFIQAFIFAILSAVYIGGAMEESH